MTSRSLLLWAYNPSFPFSYLNTSFIPRQDVEDYLSLLSSIKTYYDSIIAFEQQKSEAGLGLCDAVIDRIIHPAALSDRRRSQLYGRNLCFPFK